MKLSVVIPVYYNEDNLLALYEDVKAKLFDVVDYECELVMVDDGSADKSFEIMQQLAAQDARVKPYRLSRNFGSHSAILCGLAQSTGDCAVVKAADLQEPTELILEMVDSWKSGNNVVLAVREGREEKASQTFFANAYYWMTRKTALPTMPKTGFDTYLVDRKVIAVLESLDERNSALTGQILWSGFTTGHVYYTRRERTAGKSRWTLRKKVRLVSDTLFSFSTVPITLLESLGLISFFGGLIWALVVFINWLVGDIPVAGWTTLFIFNLISFGVIMIALGILGEYLWRIFETSKGRPPYIIEKYADETDDPRG